VPKKGDTVEYDGQTCTVSRQHGNGTFKLQALESGEFFKNIPVSDMTASQAGGEDNADGAASDEDEDEAKKRKKKKKKDKKKSKRSKEIIEEEDDEDLDENFANDSDDKLSVEDWNKKRQDAVLRKAFDQIDKDKSGKLDEHEMGIALRSTGAALTDSEVADLMMQADEDGDGQIDFGEFRHVIRKRNGKSKKERARVASDTLAHILKLFRGMDTENKGYIKADRFRSLVVNVMGIELTKREWMVRFRCLVDGCCCCCCVVVVVAFTSLKSLPTPTFQSSSFLLLLYLFVGAIHSRLCARNAISPCPIRSTRMNFCGSGTWSMCLADAFGAPKTMPSARGPKATRTVTLAWTPQEL
jgi:Ca2+-binding EF-hand superfamily protein